MKRSAASRQKRLRQILLGTLPRRKPPTTRERQLRLNEKLYGVARLTAK